MSSSYSVGVVDMVRATAATEHENKRRIVWVFGGVLVASHAVDVASGTWLFLTGDSRGTSPRRSAGDVLVLAVARAVLFPLLAALSVRKTPVEEERPSSASGPPPLEDGYVRLNGTNPRQQYDNNDGPTRPKRSIPEEKKTSGLLSLMFVVSTACQVYVGVKVNRYEWRRDAKTAEVVLMCSSVLWTNVAAFAAREIIQELTREEALYLPKVHAHGLVYDPTVCRHWCDLCQTPIRTGGAYRCKLCDFDVCLQCATRDDAATVGENVLRTDSTTRHTEALSSAAYLARAARLASTRRTALSTAIAVLGAYSALSLALPSYQGKIIDHIIDGNRRAFALAAQTYLLLMVLQGALRAVSAACFSIVSRSVLYEIRTQLFRAMLRQDIAFFDGTTSGHLSSRLTNDANAMMAPIDASLSSLLYNSVMLVGGIAMCFYTSYALSMLAFVVVGPITTLWQAYSVWSKRLTRRVLAAWAEANAIATEALAHVRTVKAFAAEASETARYVEACAEGLRLGVKDALGYGATTALAGYLDLGTGVLILWYGGLLVLGGGDSLTVGQLIQFQLYWNLMNSAYQALQGLVTSFTRAAAAAEKVFGLVDALPDIDTRLSSSSSSSSLSPVVDWPVRGDLQLDSVEFWYAMRPDKLVLDSLDLAIPANTTCALVGRSGGGKSTIVSMLLRFYDPKSGVVRLDGVDVRTLDVRRYRRRFGVVMQDTPLMARSIKTNIAYGLESEPTLGEVEAAAKKAYAYDFVSAMRDGFDTRVGERGGRLSGGQRQRIAISRVFLRQPKIVLLDEATSALDEESQAAVQKSLDALIARGGSTVVLVAHRLTTVVAADKIAVVDSGRIIEQGTHHSLVSKHDGIYAALVKRQLAKAAQHLDDDDVDTSLQQKAKKHLEGGNDSVDALIDEIGITTTPP
ncbi:hypothetical protein CTAYLR_009737 [Chrysophaeum taylorii]|uniref:Uncharacterized protein n=1 Tax=Chrysophaeum taylorii TaxID=2483200 RepID=A0AAD7UHG2_9STRA|nr:hypothetical protein CTAYLR_009737 [Chrysophaeum taylorii]